MFKPRITKRIPILVEGMYSKFSNLITIDVDGRVFVEYFSETEENDKSLTEGGVEITDIIGGKYDSSTSNTIANYCIRNIREAHQGYWFLEKTTAMNKCAEILEKQSTLDAIRNNNAPVLGIHTNDESIISLENGNVHMCMGTYDSNIVCTIDGWLIRKLPLLVKIQKDSETPKTELKVDDVNRACLS